MSYSIGFRAPSHADILLDFAQEAASRASEDQRYSDAGMPLQKNASEISLNAIETISGILQHYLSDKTLLAQWLGETMTQVKTTLTADIDLITPAEVQNNKPFRLNPFSRGTFFDCSTLTESNEGALLFVDGVSYPCSRGFAIELTSGGNPRFNNLDTVDRKVALQLAELALLV